MHLKMATETENLINSTMCDITLNGYTSIPIIDGGPILCTRLKIKNKYVYRFYDYRFELITSLFVNNPYTEKEILKVFKAYENHTIETFYKIIKREVYDIINRKITENEFFCYIEIYDYYGRLKYRKRLEKYNTFLICPSFESSYRMRSLKPYRIKIETNENGSIVHYYGYDTYLFRREHNKKVEFNMNLFQDSLLDKEWCILNYDTIRNHSGYFQFARHVILNPFFLFDR